MKTINNAFENMKTIKLVIFNDGGNGTLYHVVHGKKN